ncbi:MAG: hemagglutinin, partial [Cutibacterium sp.]|nr:hemagglutinin [Cutibacterium sp.]
MRIQRTLSNKKGALALAVLVAALAGCGGGDGTETPQGQATPQSPNSPVTGTPESPTTPAKPTSLVAPSCLNCGAVDSSTYAGTGVGVWQATNATSAAADVPVSIDGLTGQDVTLVFTNESGVAQPMPAISLTASRFPSVAASQLRWQDPATDAKQRIGEFNRNGWAALAGSQGTGPRYSMSSGPSKSVVNDTRDWFNE